MLNTIAQWVGWFVMGGGVLFLLIWSSLTVLDRGVRMSGLVLVITAWAKQNRPGVFRLIQTGLFKRGPAPPQRRS